MIIMSYARFQILHNPIFPFSDHIQIKFLIYFLQLTRDLSENSISQLPEHFLHKQNHLKHLFLRRNHIKFIPSGMFNGLTSLTWLMLQENDLYQFPLQELEMLVSLEWLNISHNHLRFEGDRFPEELVNIMEM